MALHEAESMSGRIAGINEGDLLLLKPDCWAKVVAVAMTMYGDGGATIMIEAKKLTPEEEDMLNKALKKVGR